MATTDYLIAAGMVAWAVVVIVADWRIHRWINRQHDGRKARG